MKVVWYSGLAGVFGTAEVTAALGRSFCGGAVQRASGEVVRRNYRWRLFKGLGGRSHCKERELSQTRRPAAPPRNVIVIEGLLLASSHLGLVRTTFLFKHVSKHFAIPSRRLIDFELTLSKLFKFLKLRFEFFSALLQILYLPVGDMKLQADAGLEALGNARSI